MFFTDKYAEQVASYVIKAAFAGKKEGRKIVSMTERRGDTDIAWYASQYWAYAISEHCNPIKTTEHSLIATVSRPIIPQRIPYRELRRTDRLEKKSKFTYVVFEDESGKETLVNEKYLTLADKYPYPVRYYQEEWTSMVVIADNDDMIALIMPTVKR